MKRAKLIGIITAMALMVSVLAGCGSSGDAVKQTAAAKLTAGDADVALMTVDLTGGYSVEFASGAAYFFKGDNIEDSDVAAFAFVMTKEEYEDEVEYLQENAADELQDLGEGIYAYGGDYFFPAEDGLYVKVAVQESAMDDADSIYPRFTVKAVD